MTTTIAEKKIVLDEATVRRLLDEAIAEKGVDYVYPQRNNEHGLSSCWYLDYDDESRANPVGPSCIVGHVLVKAGVPMERLMGCEGTSASTLLELRLYDLVEVPARVVTALEEAQARQDSGDTWGEARAAFELRLSL